MYVHTHSCFGLDGNFWQNLKRRDAHRHVVPSVAMPRKVPRDAARRMTYRRRDARRSTSTVRAGGAPEEKHRAHPEGDRRGARAVAI